MSSDTDPTLSEIDTLLSRFGRDITEDIVFAIVESVLCSAYGIFFAVASERAQVMGFYCHACRRGYLYASPVAQWALNVWTAFRGAHSLLMVPFFYVPIPDRPDLADENASIIIPPEEALFVINMIIGDSVVVWRIWAVYQQRILAILVPCILLLMSCIWGLIDITCNSHDGAAPLPGDGVACLHAATISWAFSAATNIACTIFIGFKAWYGLRSSFLFTQIVIYIGFSRSSPRFYAWAVLKPIGNQMAGLYPTLIIVIVNFRRTIWEEEPSTTVLNNSLRWEPNSHGSVIIDIFSTQREGEVVQPHSVIDISPEKSLRPAADDYAV
ncbi:hypothetical protein C8R45DRAFT_1109197 [Mycena sanguinolenta]|nr:hypothetical protein C8R45DRAFT_1109197 [Mycena sanguinolenta]